MRKNIIAITLAILLTGLSAKEMNLWSNDKGEEEFATLTVEEQYTSYVNTYKNKNDMFGQARKWAKRMVGQYGRDVIPLMNETISVMTFDNAYKEPYESTSECIWYVVCYLVDYNLLTDIEKELYAQIFQAKIDNYILKYKTIDKTVILEHSYLVVLKGLDIRKETAETWRNYYQERLDIDDIIVGDIPQYLQ